MSHFSNSAEKRVAEHLFGIATLTPATPFCRLHTAYAGEDGTTSEVSGGSYAALSCAMEWDNSLKLVKNTSVLNYSAMPAATLLGFSLHTLATGGLCLGRGDITSTAILAGQTARIAAGGLTFALAGGFSNYTREHLAKLTFNVSGGSLGTSPSAWYIELHTGAPGNDGTANVVSGGSYARQNCTSWVWDTNRVENNAVISFAGMPSATVTHFSIHSAVTGGNCFGTGALDSSSAVGAGGTSEFAAGALGFEVQ